jgi:hypothetical protein
MPSCCCGPDFPPMKTLLAFDLFIRATSPWARRAAARLRRARALLPFAPRCDTGGGPPSGHIGLPDLGQARYATAGLLCRARGLLERGNRQAARRTDLFGFPGKTWTAARSIVLPGRYGGVAPIPPAAHRTTGRLRAPCVLSQPHARQFVCAPGSVDRHRCGIRYQGSSTERFFMIRVQRRALTRWPAIRCAGLFSITRRMRPLCTLAKPPGCAFVVLRVRSCHHSTDPAIAYLRFELVHLSIDAVERLRAPEGQRKPAQFRRGEAVVLRRVQPIATDKEAFPFPARAGQLAAEQYAQQPECRVRNPRAPGLPKRNRARCNAQELRARAKGEPMRSPECPEAPSGNASPTSANLHRLTLKTFRRG